MRTLLVILIIGVASATAQIASGGAYAMEQSVIANGGGNSATGNYAVNGTSGQAAAGTNTAGGNYTMRAGFWTPLLGPTAASASITGRVTRIDGVGIRNVRVTVSGGTLTTPRTALTTSMGYFTFDELATGHSYVVSIVSKRYGFAQSSQVVQVTDNVADLLFTSSWEN